MGQSIVEIRTFGEALRNTGYKSIDSAVAEIVDNSIEADAKNTFIILQEGIINPLAKRRVKCIQEIAFLDNGIGMDEEVLGKCLGYGTGTRYERKGMGRFGVGLPQASMYAAPRVEVYSWQNGIENCKKVYLDIREVTSGEQTEIEEPMLIEFPEKYKKFLNYCCNEKQYEFLEHGTLVIWKECDRVSPKTIPYLKPQLVFSLGQKFRYFLTGGKRNIRIINFYDDMIYSDVKPNDPLFLMEDNRILGNPENPGSIATEKCENKETLFEPYKVEDNPTEEYVVKYYDRKEETVKETKITIKFSKIKKKFYDQSAFPTGNPGASEMGKEVEKLQGISVVRANREIDFGKFDYYDNQNKPTHRWWGCEINFQPELDEAFGVANNKQYVELKKVSEEDYKDEDVKPMWLQLYDIVAKTIDKMVKENKVLQENARTKKTQNLPAENIISTVEEKENQEGMATEQGREKNTLDEIDASIIEDIKKTNNNETPTQEAIEAFRNSKVKFIYDDVRRGPFLDYDFSCGVARIYINISHDFYKLFMPSIVENTEAKTAFELFIASLVKAIDKMEIEHKHAYDRLMQEWENRLKKYIDRQLHPGDMK